MSRRRIALLFLPALLILALAAAFAWLMRSESGANWLWQRVAAAVPGTLQAQRVSGDLQAGLNVEQLSYRDTGLAVTADSVALRLDLDFWPPAVAVHHLTIGELSVESAKEPAESESSAAEWLPQLALPVPVAFRRVEVGRVTWSGGSAEPWLELRELSLTAQWHRDLVLRDVALEHDGSPWQAELSFGFEPPHRLAVNLTGSVATPGRGEPGSDGDSRLALRAEGSGDLEQSRWRVEVEEPALALTGDLRHLLTEPEWDAQLSAPLLSWPPGEAEPALTLHDLVVSSYGTLPDYGVEAEARIGGNGLPPVDGRVVGAGDRSGLDLDVLHLAGEALAVEGTGRLEWTPSLDFRVDASVSRVDPEPWLEAWGDAEPASGRVQFAWDGAVLDFEVSEANAPGTVEALEASGAFDVDSGAVSADLAWRDLVWPPGAGEPAVVSREGRATLGGSLDAWTVRGDLQLDGPDFPEGRLVADGTGGRNGMTLQVPRGEVLGGGLSGSLDLSWSPELRWSATARLDNVATGPLAPSFPGRVSGELAVSGRAEPQELQINIQSLNGSVRGRPVQASGRLQLESGHLAARGLRIGSGRSEVTADGQLYGPDGLALEARIASLSDLADGASGSFTGSAMVSLDPSRPQLRLQGDGRELSWGETAIGRLTVSTEAAAGDRVQLELEELELGDRLIDSLTVTAAGDRPLDRLQAEMHIGERTVSLSMAGGVQDWVAPLQGGWRGRLETLRLEGPEVGRLELQSPAAIRLDAGGVELAESCFDGSREGRLCVEADWRSGGEHLLRAELDDVSPNFALTLLGSEFNFSQRLTGVVEWRQLPGSTAAALVRLDVTPGEVVVRGEDQPILTTAAGVFAFEIADGRLYSGNLDIPLAGAGGIDTDFSVPDVSLGLEAPVEGRLRVNLDSVEPLLRLVPGVEGASGPVTAELDFSGTLANPRLTGYVSLVRGRLTHFTSGLLLEDIRLAGAVYEYDETELSGTFRAGEGQGTVRTVINFADLLRPEVLLELSGDNLTLIDVPDLNLRADPDLSLTWRPGELDISGRVAVPFARLSPRYLPTASATVSADVVIVAGEDPLAQPTAKPAPDTKIRGELELKLGNDVQLSLEQATARIRGTTQFVWKGPLVPVARGSFTVSGEINAYGQLLEVTEGRVNFSGRPADNPFLNIRAEREIYDSAQVRRAGVLVTGTLKEPVLEPYTTPMTTRERAMTMLVTGSDFSSEQGTGSVEVGMYVAPKLYISYGIGLFDEQNVISVRYDLGKGFGIKTTSGQRESGADISYTIEH